jgi:hypothetical protein
MYLKIPLTFSGSCIYFAKTYFIPILMLNFLTPCSALWRWKPRPYVKKRARLIKADAECEASPKLSEASKIIAANPLALELRRMQMVQEIGADKEHDHCRFDALRHDNAVR